MKKSMQKMWGYATWILVLAVSVLFITCSEVQAAAAPKFDNNEENYLFTKKTTDVLPIQNLKKGSKVTVKSSNKGVAKASFYDYKKSNVSWFDDDDNRIKYGVKLDIKKPGTTTITCIVEQGGATYRLSCKYVVEKYKNPLKSFKIGEFNYASEFKKDTLSGGDAFYGKVRSIADEARETDASGFTDVNEEKLNELFGEKVTIKVVPKKGQKIAKIYLVAGTFSSASKDKTIRNGTSISYKELMQYESIRIEVEDKAGYITELEMLLPEETDFIY